MKNLSKSFAAPAALTLVVVLILATAALLLGVPRCWAQDAPMRGPAGAGPGAGAPPPGPHFRVFIQGALSPYMMLLRAAHLTPAQEGEVQRILARSGARTRDVFLQFRHAQEEIADKLLSPGAVTAADLEPLTRRAARLRGEMDRNMIETALAMRKILTPEQIKRLAEVHDRLESLRAQVEKLIGPGPGGALFLPPN